MPPAPAALDLADAAFSCGPLSRARRLAEWVGQGRTLTARGVLRPADATQACLDLGIKFGGARLRSALDADELMRDWVSAIAAGYIVVDGRRALGADPDEIGSPVSDPEGTLDAWVGAATFLLDLADEDPCTGCLTALAELHVATEPVTMEQMVSAVAAMIELEEPEGTACPGCGEIHGLAGELAPFDLLADEDWLGNGDWDDEDGDEDAAEHVAATVTGLLAFNAADLADEKIRLTPLGSLLAERVFQGRLVPADADVSALVSTIGDSPLPLGLTLARPWLALRSAPAAADELLTFAESAGGLPRVTALAFAGELGIESADAWRNWASRPGFGAYARLWLLEHDEPAQEDPADEAWLATDGLCALVESLADTVPLHVVHATLAEQLGGELAETADLVLGSGHPKAEYVATWLRAAHEGATRRNR
jgi:hypothetical protein